MKGLKMKKRYLVLSGLLALTLAACSQEKPATSETQTSTEEKTVQEGTAGSKSQAASQKKAEVVDKGDHYSIQGKYDEIVVANKHYPMSKDYNPGENPTAKAELLKLIAAMQQAGFPISDNYSGFRSYETQTQLYQNYVDKDGKAEADRYSARPGYSEHQTGLAFDLIGTNGDLVTEEKAAQWLLDHAADYGFVVRYLKGKEKKRVIWLKNGTFAMLAKKPKKSLQVASVWKSIMALKVETMLISRKTPCKNA